MKTVARANGAITDICYLGDNLVSTVSKDRFLRVFDIKANEETVKLYLKNQLSVLKIEENSKINNEKLKLVEEENNNKVKEDQVDDAENQEEDENEEDDMLDDDDVLDIDWDNIEIDQSFDDDDEDEKLKNKKKSGKDNKSNKNKGKGGNNIDDDGFIVIGNKKNHKKGK